MAADWTAERFDARIIGVFDDVNPSLDGAKRMILRKKYGTRAKEVSAIHHREPLELPSASLVCSSTAAGLRSAGSSPFSTASSIRMRSSSAS